MTIVLLLAFALLCGVSVGAIIGLALGWVVFAPEPDAPDIDYSGGV